MGGTHTAAIKLIGLTTVPTMVWMDVHGLNAVQESVRLLPTHEGLGGMPSRICVSVATPKQIRGRREHQQRRGNQVFVLRCGVSAHLSRPPGTTNNPRAASPGGVLDTSPWVAGTRCGGREVNCDGNRSSLERGIERRSGASWNADVGVRHLSGAMLSHWGEKMPVIIRVPDLKIRDPNKKCKHSFY